MANLPSVADKLLDEQINSESPNTEALFIDIGQNINYIIDQTDTNETRVSEIEGLTLSQDGLSSGTVATSTVSTIASNTLTPEQTKVLILISGYITGSTGCSLQLRRDSSVVFTISISDMIQDDALALSCLNFIDDSAPANTSTTWDIRIDTSPGSTAVDYNDVGIHLIEVS